jgi:hypothetical protein
LTGRRSFTAPFFIIGCARTGTTLLRRLLNAHSELAIPLESLFILDYLKSSGVRAFPELLKMLVGEPEIREWGISPGIPDLEACASVPDAIGALHRLYAMKHHKNRWGQKTPRLIRELPLILSAFPEAVFIHIVRDPRAVANSLIQSEAHRSSAYHAARRWMRDVSAGLDFERAHPERVLRMAYEVLVSSQERSLRAITAFLGVPYEPGMLQDSGGDISGEYSRFYARMHSHLGESVTQAFSSKWRGQLSTNEVHVVESICSPLMEELGYERLHSGRPGPLRTWVAALRRAPGFVLQAGHYLRYRPQYPVYLFRRKIRLGLLGSFLADINQ